jgi:hypothetical protein
MARVKRVFPDLPYITGSINTKIVVTDENDYALGYTHINTLINTIDSGGLATDGENVFTGDQLVLGNITITGDITAQNFVTSSTLLFTGSTNHGSRIEDIHTYTGSVRITGSLNVIGGINGVINATNGVVSSSAQITSFGFVSGSYETTGRNIISSSTQIKNYGDFATTGSNTFIGTQTITGSFIVSGSTTQIGNNTLVGNTVLSGSIQVSGSQTFRGTQTTTGSQFISGSSTQIGNNTLLGDNTITGSNFLLGDNVIRGNNLIVGDTILSGSIDVSGSFTGSVNIAGNLNIASGSAFYRWGNKLFNYGAFYSTTTQSGSTNVSQSMSYNNIDYSSGVSVVSGSRITLENIGVYNVQFSAQVVDTGAGDSTIRIWLKKNGTNVPNTATKIFLQSNKELVAAWNWIVPATSPNDYYEIAWQTTDNDAHILYEAASGNYPAIPSIIVTVTQIA